MIVDMWKKIEKSAPWKRAKLCIRRMAGTEVRLKPDLSRHCIELGGWHICTASIPASGGLVYSLGVERDIRFDMGLIRRYGVEIHAFDPSPATVEWIGGIELPSGFHFHPWAVTDKDGEMVLYPREKKDGTRSDCMYSLVPTGRDTSHGIRVPALTLPSIMTKLCHENDKLEILKMDVEGAEYGILEQMIQHRIFPRQLLVEFHHRFPGIGKDKTEKTVRMLRAAGYLLFSVSVTGRELSFLHGDA
jgi:FkbM family methyltransferase